MADAPPPAKPALPAADCDVLCGVDGIAAWFGWPLGRASDFVTRGIVPTFTVPGGTMRFGFKTEITAAFRAYAERPDARAKAPSRRQKCGK